MWLETTPLMLSLLADYGYQVHHYWLFIILGVLVLNSIPVVIAICGCITNRNRSETMQDRVNIPCHLPRILFCLCRQYFTCLNFFFSSIIWIGLNIFIICAKVQQLNVRTFFWRITALSVTIQILQSRFHP